MKAFALLALADLSYTTTKKTDGGTLAAFASPRADNRTAKYFLKGQKMKVDKDINGSFGEGAKDAEEP